MSLGRTHDEMARLLFESALEAGLPVLATSWSLLSAEDLEFYRCQSEWMLKLLRDKPSPTPVARA